MRKELKKFKLEKSFHEGKIPIPKPSHKFDLFYEPFGIVEENMYREDMVKKLTSIKQKFLLKSLMNGDSIHEIYQQLKLDKRKLDLMIKDIQQQLNDPKGN